MNKKGNIWARLMNPTLWLTAIAVAVAYVITQGVIIPLFVGG